MNFTNDKPVNTRIPYMKQQGMIWKLNSKYIYEIHYFSHKS